MQGAVKPPLIEKNLSRVGFSRIPAKPQPSIENVAHGG